MRNLARLLGIAAWCVCLSASPLRAVEARIVQDQCTASAKVSVFIGPISDSNNWQGRLPDFPGIGVHVGPEEFIERFGDYVDQCRNPGVIVSFLSVTDHASIPSFPSSYEPQGFPLLAYIVNQDCKVGPAWDGSDAVPAGFASDIEVNGTFKWVLSPEALFKEKTGMPTQLRLWFPWSRNPPHLQMPDLITPQEKNAAGEIACTWSLRVGQTALGPYECKATHYPPNFTSTFPRKGVTAPALIGDSVTLSPTIKGNGHTLDTSQHSGCRIIGNLWFEMAAAPVVVSFWDKEEPAREVVGAAADGASEVIIKVTGLSEDVTADEVQISLPNGEEDGWLREDAKLQDGVFTQTYVAPKDWFRKGQAEDQNEDKRKIDLQVTVKSAEIEHDPFYLFKPPVLLLHGIWGEPLTGMRNYLLTNYAKNNRLLVYAPSYANDVSFAENLQKDIPGCVSQCITNARTQPDGSIVVKKADIVAHSMGGILAVLYANSDSSQKSVNRIITIGTPHTGSEFANFALHFLYEEMSDDQRRFNLGLLELTGHCVTRGAAEDLQVGSVAMNQYRDSAIHTRLPVYAIKCHHEEGSPPSVLLSIVYGAPLNLKWESPNIPPNCQGFGLWYWDQNLDSTMTYFGGDPYDPSKVEDGLFGSIRTYSGSDFVVSLESQAGGATICSDVSVVDHMCESDDIDVQKAVVAALNSPVASFDQDGFSPLGQPAYPLPRVGTYNVKSNTWTPSHIQGFSSNESDGAVTIVSPSDGAVFAPGETVTVRASSTEPISGGMAFMSQDFSAGADDTSPYEFQFTIDPTYLGEMLIYAWFEPGDGTVKYSSVRVNVVTDQVADQIDTSPDGPLYMRPNDELSLRVDGLYPDGYRRDITSLPSTRYTSSDPNIVDVGEKGTLSSKINGHAVVSIENSGVVQSIDVTVQPLEFGDVLAPVFRFWSPVHSRHFYTASRSERDTLRADYPDVFTYEGKVFWAYLADCEAGLAAVYRFWSPSLSAHFYTISEAEKDMLIRDFPTVWTFEGTAFYAYPEGTQPAGTVPVYRFWSGTNASHFYTTSEAEKDMLIRDFPAIWTFEGIAWYAYPP